MPMLIPRVNEDGNETSGFGSVLHQAPLGSYLGWNVTASGFFKGQICGFAGGYVPFAHTRTERVAAGDPRLSLEERYGTQEGYMCVVRRAAESLVADRFLGRADADRILAAAASTAVLPAAASSSADDRRIAEARCR
jgi:alpha/beta hydrolase family protein